MHILFITSNNLATNPRLFKEINHALTQGYNCTLIEYKLGNWSDKKSDELINVLRVNDEQLKENKQDNNLKIITVDATPDNKISWLKWGLAEKLAQRFYPILKNHTGFNALASSKRSIQLLKAAKKLLQKPDLVCAHNLAALYPAHKLSTKWNIPFVFDVEDYHPGEFIHMDKQNEKQRREFLMKKLLPQAKAITSASTLIGNYTLKLIGGHHNHTVILNSFPQNEFTSPILTSKNQNIQTSNIKLIWFSQKISFGRGLEQLFKALTQLINSTTQQLNLTLIGELDPSFEQQVITPFITHVQASKHPNIIHLNIIPPLSQRELHAELAKHDIGLALEFNSADFNRQLCLTNKIMAYAQAGLYILATDTPAQKEFIKETSILGQLCLQTSTGIKESINKLNTTVCSLDNKIKRYHFSKGFSWEEELKKYESIWKIYPE